MNHLNEQQFAELLSASRRELLELGSGSRLASLHAHASACADCTAELEQIRESLSLFRQASSAYANAYVHTIPAWQPPARRPYTLQPAYWAVAAAAVFLAAFVPLEIATRRPVQPHPQTPVAAMPQQSSAETDEALLKDVNRELSESVPTSMAALADPTGSSTQAQNSMQRTN